MPLFEGHKDKGIARLFVEMPEEARGSVVWKYPDAQLMKHTTVNVDLDEVAVFTNLGKVIGIFTPGRYQLGDGASLALGWLVDRLTTDAYYDTELYFVVTHDIVNIDFGGPIDNVSDKETGLVVSIRVYGDLAFKVIDPTLLLTRLVGTGGLVDHNAEVIEWVKDQTLAAIRAALPALVAEHGILYMGAIQDAAAAASLAAANASLAAYGVAITTFAQLNVNLPDDDAARVKNLAQAKAMTGVAGSFTEYARGQAMIDIAEGVQSGHVEAQPGMMVGMMMGTNPMGGIAPAAAPAAAPIAPHGAGAGVGVGAHFCPNCGAALGTAGAHFCPNCGSAIDAQAAPAASAAPIAAPAVSAAGPATASQGPGWWEASDGKWYPPEEHPGAPST